MKTLKYILLIAIIIGGMQLTARAQEEQQVLTLQAVVKMPEIPENITDITDRYKYFVQHFWDSFDFKQKSVGQYQLNDAFGQYATALRFTPVDDAMKSVDALIKKLDKNPTLMYQFCVAAEGTMYDPQRAEFLIDEVYVKFLDGVMRNKKIKPERKARFALQYGSLGQTLKGMQAPQFNFEDRTGVETRYNPEARKSIIFFGHPDCADCMMAKVRMEMDAALDAKCRNGEARIYYIIPDKDNANWKEMVADYPHYWTVGAGDDLETIYDLRFNPTIYVIGADRKIQLKTVNVDDAINAVTQ